MPSQLFPTNDVSKFRPRTFEVAAIQATRDNIGEVVAWLRGQGIKARVTDLLDGWIVGEVGRGGTFVLQGSYVIVRDALVSVMTAEQFEQTFELVTIADESLPSRYDAPHG